MLAVSCARAFANSLVFGRVEPDWADLFGKPDQDARLRPRLGLALSV